VGVGAIVIWFGSTAVIADAPSAAAASSTTQTPGAGVANEYCPVMPKTNAEADLWLDYEGQRIYFCHEVCKTRFRRTPEKYQANLPAAMRQAIGEYQRAESMAESSTQDMAEYHHDHMADHPATSGLRRVGQFLGRFHPVVVHLPIGVLLAAALAEVLFMGTRAEWLSGAARFRYPFTGRPA
jgi:YHS domain-containing protein